MVALLAWVAYSQAGNPGDNEAVALPNVVGKSRSEAEEMLRSRSFRVETQTRRSSDEDAGEVVEQSPSGDRAKPGSTVEIVVGEAKPTEQRPAANQASGPTPGYNLVETPDGGLSAEVPSSWGVELGEDSEKEGTGTGSWSYYAGEYLFSSITTAPDLGVWYSPEPKSGAYFVASKALAQHSDYELTHSLFNAGKDETCAEAGPYEDYDRPTLSGKLQTWYGCGADGATVYTLVAYPEGRECVVALNARVSEEADRETMEHLVNTVDVDCDSVTSGPLAIPSTSASASASPG
jgi:hypothetical protein